MTDYHVYRGQDGLLTFEQNGPILFTISTGSQTYADEALMNLKRFEVREESQIDDIETDEI
jgi:hypothetical protein